MKVLPYRIVYFLLVCFCLLLVIVAVPTVVPAATIGRLRSTLPTVTTATTCTSAMMATATRTTTAVRRIAFLFVAFSRRKSGHGKQLFLKDFEILRS